LRADRQGALRCEQQADLFKPFGVPLSAHALQGAR